jgi:hypothetical protein
LIGVPSPVVMPCVKARSTPDPDYISRGEGEVSLVLGVWSVDPPPLLRVATNHCWRMSDLIGLGFGSPTSSGNGS